MPLHDWSSQTAEVFHDFHNAWVIHIKESLNDGVLPGNLFARSEAGVDIESSADGGGADRVHRVPDVDVVRNRFDDDPGGVVAVAEAPPKAKRSLRLAAQLERQKRVAVRTGGGELVAAIEVVSHANLASTAERLRFADKCVRLIDSGVHVAVLDLHPRAGTTPPVEELIVRECGRESAAVRNEGEALVTSIHAVPAPDAYFDPVRPGEPLPATPLFVGSEHYVRMPLAESYDRAFRGLDRRTKGELAAATPAATGPAVD